MKFHQLAIEDALRSLNSSPLGLTAREAERRFVEFGPNCVQRARRRPLILRLLSELTHFFALILWVAATMAFWVEWKEPGQGMGTLGCAIVAVVLINSVFSFWQVWRAERALKALEKLLPRRAKVLRDAVFVEISVEQLVPGDVISVESGDVVPADCRLLQAFDVKVSNAVVTGESQAEARSQAPSTADDVLQSTNSLLAGTVVVSGTGKAVVHATGMQTQFGRIAQLVQATEERPFPLQREITFLSHVVAVLATMLGIVFFLIGLTIPLSFWQNVLFAIGIIVANVPEGLLPTVTLAMAMGAQRMARRDVLIRRLPAVETLGSATVICTDKTGTLTENRMSVVKAYLGGRWFDVGTDAGPEVSTELHHRFFAAARYCENGQLATNAGNGNLFGDPTEVALLQLALRVLPMSEELNRIDEIPFDSDRKRLSTLYRSSKGVVLYTKGALETVLPLCTPVRSDNGHSEPISDNARDGVLAAQGVMADVGLRVLALASRDVDRNCQHSELEQGLVLEGLAALEDPPRSEVPRAIEQCREAGIKVIMLTGDHPQTAVGIARQIGLVRSSNPVVIDGNRLRKLSDSQLQLALDAPEILFARMGADQKVRIVEVLQRKGEIVAVTGDGVNDAPALKQADIGIAMGATGSDVARETADMVLLNDNFASIVGAVEEGRAVFDNVRKFLTYILTSNIPELVPYLAFVLIRIPLPLTIMQILAVDLGTDMVPALALGAERADPAVMRRPPRSRNERLLTWPLLARAYLFLGAIEAAAAMAAYSVVLRSAGWIHGQVILPGADLYSVYLQATTACLAGIVVMQIANVLICRSTTQSIFQQPLFSNKLLAVGIVTELLMIVCISYTSIGNRIFQAAPLPASVWLFLAPLPLLMIAFEEMRKSIVRSRNRQAHNCSGMQIGGTD